MNLDIQPVILDFLSRRKSVDIPGLGRLFWSVQRSRRGDTSAELHAPAAKLLFEPGQSPSSDLLNYIIEKFNIPEERAEKWLTGWGSQARKKIEEQGKLDMQAIGTFTKDQDGIKFSMDTTILNQNLELSDMALTPVARELELSGNAAPKVVEDQEEDEKGLLMWILLNILIPILLLLAIGTMSFFIYRQLTTGSTNKEVVTSDETPQGSDPEVVIADSSEGSNEMQNEDIPESSVEYSSDQDTTASPQETQSPVVTTEDSSDWVEEEIPLGNERAALDTFDKRFCIIIVGSFVNPVYAQEMIEKVEAMGFIVYTEPYGRFTRVGVRFDCYETDLYRQLFELRGTFSEDAWILKYREDGE